jgi:hypothetical protein
MVLEEDHEPGVGCIPAERGIRRRGDAAEACPRGDTKQHPGQDATVEERRSRDCCRERASMAMLDEMMNVPRLSAFMPLDTSRLRLTFLAAQDLVGGQPRRAGVHFGNRARCRRVASGRSMV